MKRHAALVPLSHDHHHALAQAKRLREGGDVSAFRRFYLGDMVRHFREEEELLFPLLVGADGEVPELLAEALVQHSRIHAAVRRLPEGARELGERVEEHVRLEERRLFPLVERLLDGAEPGAAEPEAPTLDLGGGLGGIASGDLNASVVAWEPGATSPETVNAERDVLVVPLAGSGSIAIDRRELALEGRRAVVVPKGARRRFAAGPVGLRYLTAHLRRDPTLQIRRGGST
jgi:hypothetical protein